VPMVAEEMCVLGTAEVELDQDIIPPSFTFFHR